MASRPQHNTIAAQQTRLRRAWDLFVATHAPDFRDGEAAHKFTFKAGFDACAAPETYGIIPAEVPDRS